MGEAAAAGFCSAAFLETSILITRVKTAGEKLTS